MLLLLLLLGFLIANLVDEVVHYLLALHADVYVDNFLVEALVRVKDELGFRDKLCFE